MKGEVRTTADDGEMDALTSSEVLYEMGHAQVRIETAVLRL